MKKLENGPPVDFPVAIRILGPGERVLYRLAEQLRDHLLTMPSAAAVSDVSLFLKCLYSTSMTSFLILPVKRVSAGP